MRVACVCLVVLLAAAVRAAPAEFAVRLPEGIADVTGWELVAGEFHTAGFRGSYRFYVNPTRQAMYQLMRFRTSEKDVARAPLDAERVAFIPRPGVAEPMRCWVRNAPGAGQPWRAIDPATQEYKVEMVTLMRVLSVHRNALASRTR